MPLCYEQNFEVFHFECDVWDNMKPAAVLRRAQEIATDQCESLGLNEDLYKRTNTVFLLSKLSLLVWRMPCVDEKVRIETRAYGVKRAVYHRVTSFYSVQGEKLCETDGRWVLVDTVNRRIQRKPLDEFLPYFNEEPSEEHQMEVPRVQNYPTGVKHVAVYSLCDRNGHINNTRYVDLACDALPLEKLAKDGVSRMVMNYRSENPTDLLHSPPQAENATKDSLVYQPIHRMVMNYRSEIALGDEFEFVCVPMGEGKFTCAALQAGMRQFECFIE